MSSTSVLPEAPTHLDGVGDAGLLGMLVDVVGRLGRQELGGAVGDAELTRSVGVLHRVETMVHAEKLRRVAEVDARAAYVSQGARSTADLLGGLGLTRGEARSQAETATALTRLPQVADRMARGEVGVGQAEVAARELRNLPVTGDPDADRATVGELDELVASHGASQDRRQLGRTVEEWAHRRNGDHLAERERRAFLLRHLWAGPGVDGQPLIEGKLTPIVLAKLGAMLDPLARRTGDDDDRSIGQRRHDALETVLDRAAAVTDRHPDPDDPGFGGRGNGDGGSGGGPVRSFGGGRAQVLLITTPEALHGQPGAAASELDGFGPVSSETARQICCDADVTTVTVGPDGTPLDVSPTRRFPTRRQRLAVIARDRRCVGCSAPTSRCHLHHVRWRSDGGPTAVANLCLLCPGCHTNVHHFAWTVRRAGAGFRARPPPDLLRSTG